MALSVAGHGTFYLVNSFSTQNNLRKYDIKRLPSIMLWETGVMTHRSHVNGFLKTLFASEFPESSKQICLVL